MTDSHEPSYYEIALTNRQVVVAFVILLLCLVSAFFSGLWLGRESAARAEEQIVRNTPPAPVEPQEGEKLDELRFFEDDKQPGRSGAATATPAPARDTTLLQDLGGKNETPAAADPDLPEGRRSRGQREAGDDDEQTPAPAVPAATATPVRPQPTAAPAVSPEPVAPEPRLRKGQVVIQVFSSADREQAEGVRNRLTKGGQKAYLSPVQVGGRTMYRIRIGPFDSRDEAEKVAEQVRKGYKLDTWVTE